MTIIHIILLCVSLASLIWVTDILIAGASTLAVKYSVSPLIIGVFIIGLGTSLPELGISVFSALNQDLPLAIGNAIGSNTANIALIFGVCYLFPSFRVVGDIVKKHLPIVLITCVLPGIALMSDMHLSRVDGILLIAVFALCAYLIRKVSMSETDDGVEDEDVDMPKMVRRPYLMTFAGLAGLLICTEITVYAAIKVATDFHIPTHIIGLTILAIGSSLPELITAVIGILRKHSALVIGNIFGSLMFNAAAINGISAIVFPATLPEVLLTRDITIMLGLILLLGLFLTRLPRYNFVKGAILLIIFIVYELTLYLT